MSLMWDYDHKTLPRSLASLFDRCNEIHSKNLRDTSKNKIYTAHRHNNRYGYKRVTLSPGIELQFSTKQRPKVL